MLYAGSVMEIEILLDLALLSTLGRLVDRKLDGERIVGHHDAHQGAVLGGNILVVKADEAAEAEHAAVPFGPFVHLSQLDVAHNVVDTQDSGRIAGDFPRGKARQERTAIVLVREKRVDRV